MRKHSISIRGHRTSFSLEDAFWQELKREADARSMSMARLVTEIDDGRGPDVNLSSAIRLFVLDALKARANPQIR